MQQMGLAEAYDRQLMQRILTLSACWPQETLAVPITIDSLLQPGFQRTLRDMLLQCTKSQRQRFYLNLQRRKCVNTSIDYSRRCVY